MLLAVGLTVLTSGCWWPQVGAGPDRRSYNAAESQPDLGERGAICRSAWTVELPKGSSEPVVADDAVYVTSDFYLHAIGRSSGEGLWTPSDRPGIPVGAPVAERPDGPAGHGRGGRRRRASTRAEASSTNRYRRASSRRPASRSPELGAAGQLATQRGARLASSGSTTPRPARSSSVSVIDRDAGTSWGGIVTASGTTDARRGPALRGRRQHRLGLRPLDAVPAIPEAPSYRSAHRPGRPRSTAASDPSSSARTRRRSTSAPGRHALRPERRHRCHPVAGGGRFAGRPGRGAREGHAVRADRRRLPGHLPAGGCGAATCPVTWRGTAARTDHRAAGGRRWRGVRRVATDGHGVRRRWLRRRHLLAVVDLADISWVGTPGGVVKGLPSPAARSSSDGPTA